MTNRVRLTFMSVVLLPFLALAAPQEARTARESERLERLERKERRERMRLVLGLTEALELDTAQALKLDEALRQFDERRRPLMTQVRESARTLMLAAGGDAEAARQVDAASKQAFDARAQLVALDRELFQTLSKDLPPQKKAKLALFLAGSQGAGRLKGLGQLRNAEEKQQRRLMRQRQRMERQDRG